MDVSSILNEIQKTGILLVFFYLAILLGCGEGQGKSQPQLEFENGRAISVRFKGIDGIDSYKIYLSGETKTHVLGQFTKDGSEITFIPAVPFTAATSYTIRTGTDSIAGFEVLEQQSGAAAPELLSVYPERDTVPENLLKCYLRFSRPMQSVGRALDFIKVTRAGSGEEVSVFLDMPAELWNRDRTQLTLWFDPGRIKSGLIPNKNLGKPLEEGESYHILISGEWRSEDGIPLKEAYQKTYYVGPPDKVKPNPVNWQVMLPKAGTNDPLFIRFEAPVDTFIAREAMLVFHDDNGAVSGNWEVSIPETELKFTPETSWDEGPYTLVTDTRMEDLAGNNLNRLFDTNLKTEVPQNEALDEIRRNFIIGF
jgi:hypothetical protein